MSAPLTADSGPIAAAPGLWAGLASPDTFYGRAGRLLPWCRALALLCAGAGLTLGLLFAPAEGPQGDLARIVYVHVPAAWMSIAIGAAMAVAAVLALVPGARLAAIVAVALAPTGALMSFVALWTGAMWSKPAAGVWWTWDARLYAEFLLLAVYIGCLALPVAIGDARRRTRAAAALAVTGLLGVALFYRKAAWWDAAHAVTDPLQGANLQHLQQAGLALTATAFGMWSLAAVLHRARSMILEHEGVALPPPRPPPARP